VTRLLKGVAIGLAIVLGAVLLFFSWAVASYGWEEVTWLWNGWS
jgi:hypothetical protein